MFKTNNWNKYLDYGTECSCDFAGEKLEDASNDKATVQAELEQMPMVGPAVELAQAQGGGRRK